MLPKAPCYNDYTRSLKTLLILIGIMLDSLEGSNLEPQTARHIDLVQNMLLHNFPAAASGIRFKPLGKVCISRVFDI